MKKFFDKIRRWLIKKLGGYVAPLPSAPIEVKTYTRPIEKLCWECKIPMDGYYGLESTDRVRILHEIERAAMKNLTEELFNKGFVNVQTSSIDEPDPFSNRRIRYTILVARP